MNIRLRGLLLVTISVLIVGFVARDFFFQGWPFHVELREAAVENILVRTRADISDARVVNDLKGFADENGMKFRSSYPENKGRTTVNIELVGSVGRFTVDDFLQEHIYNCYFFASERSAKKYGPIFEKFRAVFAREHAIEIKNNL